MTHENVRRSRHMTLAMLAHSFLAITAHQAKKRGPKQANN